MPQVNMPDGKHAVNLCAGSGTTLITLSKLLDWVFLTRACFIVYAFQSSMYQSPYSLSFTKAFLLSK